MQWMTSRAALSALIRFDADLAGMFFGGPDGFVIGAAPAGWATTAVQKYTSHAAYLADPAAASHRWVLYDTEAWPDTPTIEQQHPREYLIRFADQAHVLGAKVIEAPARTLCGVAGGDFHGTGRLSVTYIQKQVARACFLADVYHCQAQAEQFDYAAYQALVTGARGQTPPGQVMWAGLTTMRPGNTAAQLVDCHKIAADAGATGFWLNAHADEAPMLAEALTKMTP